MVTPIVILVVTVWLSSLALILAVPGIFPAVKVVFTIPLTVLPLVGLTVPNITLVKFIIKPLVI